MPVLSGGFETGSDGWINTSSGSPVIRLSNAVFVRSGSWAADVSADTLQIGIGLRALPAEASNAVITASVWIKILPNMTKGICNLACIRPKTQSTCQRPYIVVTTNGNNLLLRLPLQGSPISVLGYPLIPEHLWMIGLSLTNRQHQHSVEMLASGNPQINM